MPTLEEARNALLGRRFDDARILYEAIVRDEPNQYRAWLALSALAQRDGDFRGALIGARRARDAWKGTAQAGHLADVSRRLLVLGDYEAAVALITAADWTSAVTLRQGVMLAQYLDLAGLHQAALELAEIAERASRAGNPKLSYVKAGILQHLGRMEEAEAAYEACIDADPAFAEAYWSLATQAGPEAAGRRIARIRAALARNTFEPADEAYLWYASFRELDVLGEYRAAWDALARGMRIKRSTVNHDALRDQGGRTAMQALCTRDFIQAEEHGEQTHAPVFVVGLPRSGTTLLERILSSHPKMASAGELGDFTMELSWQAGCFMSPEPDARQVDAIRHVEFRELGSRYLARTRWRSGGYTHLIDKFPGNFVYTGIIGKAIANAKVVVLRRSGMDSCFSLMKQIFSESAYSYSYDIEETASHYLGFELLRRHWQETLGDRILMVDYEDIVADTGREARRIAQYCGVEFDASMENPHENPLPSATASSVQVRNPVHAGFIGQWKRYAFALQPLLDRIGTDERKM